MSFNLRCKKAEPTAVNKPSFSQVAVIEIRRWDWMYPQSVCLRLFPANKPYSFTKRIRCLNGGWKCDNVVAALEV